MIFGNRVGVEIENVIKEDLFGLNYGNLVVEVKNEVNVEEIFNDCLYKVIGRIIVFV